MKLEKGMRNAVAMNSSALPPNPPTSSRRRVFIILNPSRTCFLVRGACPTKTNAGETCAMDLWIALGIFLLGAGAGALSTAVLQVKQIRQLRDLLKAAHNDPKTEDHCHKPDGASPA